jgi:dipeptidyl aminopeptidase/acylaminoacyl peptidase
MRAIVPALQYESALVSTIAEQIVAALRGRNQRVEYVRFENEGHGIFRLENKVRAYGELVRFFNDVLGAP